MSSGLAYDGMTSRRVQSLPANTHTLSVSAPLMVCCASTTLILNTLSLTAPLWLAYWQRYWREATIAGMVTALDVEPLSQR